MFVRCGEHQTTVLFRSRDWNANLEVAAPDVLPDRLRKKLHGIAFQYDNDLTQINQLKEI